MTSFDAAVLAAKALDSKKGREISVLRTLEVTELCDYFVIATGGSNTQVKALADEAQYQLENAGYEMKHREGYDGGGWILLDFNTVIIHVFLPKERDFYDLDKLWSRAEPVEIDFDETEEKSN